MLKNGSVIRSKYYRDDVTSFIQNKGPRWDLVCLVWTPRSVILVWWAWTGPPAPACYARTGWDTCPASLAPLALKVLLNVTQIYQSLVK